MSVNIAFDSYAILGPMSRNRGIGNYALSQFTGMIERDRENHYFFLNMTDGSFSLREHISGDAANFTEDFISTGKNNVLLRDERYSGVVGQIIRNYIRENSIDMFWVTSPFEHEFLPYRKEWFSGIFTAATVYDIIPYVMKEKYLSDKETYRWYMECIGSLKNYDRLFVISDSVKDDLTSLLGFSPDNIDVIWGGVGKQYVKKELPPQELSALMKKYHISRKFIMCTGGEDSRKNLDGLVRAYSMLPENIRREYQLAVVCKLSESGTEKLLDIAEKHGAGGDVICTGFVPDDDLVSIYNAASLMAFPSKYEGFGLPVVEAWACGTPVLTADNSSLSQIAGDAAVLVDADSDKSIAAGLQKMLSDEKVLADYAARGEKRLELYRWDKVNDDIIAMLREIKLPATAEKKRVRIAMFTPLPPVHSGISDYSEDIITEMSVYCDVDVFIDDGYTPTSHFPENVRIFPHGEYEQMRSAYTGTVFQMGNSEFHYYMYNYIRKYHGCVVLHDYNLHGAFCHLALNVRKKDFALYRELLSSDLTKAEADAYISSVSGGAAPDIYGRELNSYITSQADSIIVHSREAAEKLLKKDISRRVKVIPSYACILPLADAKEVKEKNGFSRDTLIISAFGGIHTTKRAIPSLKAFAMLKKDIPDSHFIFAGKLSDEIKADFEQTVKQYALTGSVTVTGYADIEKFKEYIDMTDICLNLRYPSNGETSGSFMRILAKGKCSVVNATGSFAEFPDDICIKLPPVEQTGEANEPAVIYEALRKAACDSDFREKTGSLARKFAEEYLDIKKIAKIYYEYVTLTPSPSPVTEELISLLRQDKNFSSSDTPPLSTTLAYAKMYLF